LAVQITDTYLCEIEIFTLIYDEENTVPVDGHVRGIDLEF
jgi:hypothetical protein